MLIASSAMPDVSRKPAARSALRRKRPEGHSAVDADRLARDEADVVGEQQGAQRGDVVGLAEPGLDHLPCAGLRDDAVGHRLLVELVVPNKAWRNGIGANPL